MHLGLDIRGQLMRWLVTGAAGQLGTDVTAVLKMYGEDVVPCGRGMLDISEPDSVQSVAPEPMPAGQFRGDATYLITGGLGALGLSLAELMAARGAGALALAGRTAPGPEACRRIDYRARFVAKIRASAPAMRALRQVVDRARRDDLFLMCMCPYETPERACHTYLLLDLARELDPTLPLLAEPGPRARPLRPLREVAPSDADRRTGDRPGRSAAQGDARAMSPTTRTRVRSELPGR